MRLLAILFSYFVSTVVLLAGNLRRVLARLPRGGPIERREIRSIALIRLDEMGDFVIFSSILRSVRESFPASHITLILTDWVCPLAAACPYIDEVVPFPTDGPKWRQYLAAPFHAWRIARKLTRHFDLVVNSRFDRDMRGAGFLAHLTRARWILGYPSATDPFKAAVNAGYDRLYTHLLPTAPEPIHEIERSRIVLAFLGFRPGRYQPELWLTSEDRRIALDLLTSQSWRPGDPLIALGISAGYARKRWPIQSFIDLAARLRDLTPARFLIVGGGSDYATGELLRLALGPRLINLAGSSPIRVSAAALAHCSLYVGNDSGPKHLAAALGKPVVEINCHPIDGDPTHFQAPARFRALTASNLILAPAVAVGSCTASCMADTPHCITQVSVDEILEAVAVVLNLSVAAHE